MLYHIRLLSPDSIFSVKLLTSGKASIQSKYLATKNTYTQQNRFLPSPSIPSSPTHTTITNQKNSPSAGPQTPTPSFFPLYLSPLHEIDRSFRTWWSTYQIYNNAVVVVAAQLLLWTAAETVCCRCSAVWRKSDCSRNGGRTASPTSAGAPHLHLTTFIGVCAYVMQLFCYCCYHR